MSANNTLWLYLLCAPLFPAWAQTDRFSPEKLVNDYEHITHTEEAVQYEQRMYRNPFIGLFEMQRIMADSGVQHYSPLFQGMPVGVYSKGQSWNYRPMEPNERKEYYSHSKAPLQLKGYKLDFWLQPYFTANFGNFDKPVESNTSIAIQTSLMLWPGMALHTGILFPITNDLDGRPRNIRPAPSYLNQFWAQGKHFISASLGFFANDQYGLNIQYRHADLSKPWSMGVEAGYTGFYYYPKGGIYYESLEHLLLLADVAYRFKGPDLTAKLTGGQFMYQDRGLRMELIRQFTSIELGLYASKTKNGSTVGFNIAVPIPPGKILQGKHVRLRTGDEFRWEYTYTRGYKIGERYRMGYSLDQKLRQYQVDYLNRQQKQLD
ncbi:exopolysaccharide biosynthesis protein YbjH [Dyadobacter jejuensis]|uniref:Exopolysaccharide biosynthesis protein YbjH n=1 Tax=Dyadobacter jejuensis TaxID=1082580 RepID=A0A316ADX0_9BACT|nr:YjbH domain-containing protein [Dyadobacter jejuensis]PWJ55976.1 exopolysaccharide biosynthesis protein YbjH [Dyadobacter jejuensis]